MYRSYSGQARAYTAQSGLEAALKETMPAYHPACAGQAYEVIKRGAYAAISSTAHAQNTYALPAAADELKTIKVIYESQPAAFLNPERPMMQFIAEAGHIADLVKEAFSATTQQQMPADITITVAQRKILQRTHSQFLNSSVVGLSLNASREVFAVAGNLDEVMLVIGHELGHILSPALSDRKAEEAKAFAFESAWAAAIFENDVGGLRNSINAAALSMLPAQNGLHNIAFAFVKAAVTSGKEPLALHSELSWQQVEFSEATYVPIASTSTPNYHSGGYLNRSNVHNIPWLNNFSWADLGAGIYGMYIPLTASIFMNERLLKNNLEQFHKTLGHEYVLHHVMQLPDGYVAKVMEEAIFWTEEKKGKYRP